MVNNYQLKFPHLAPHLHKKLAKIFSVETHRDQHLFKDY